MERSRKRRKEDEDAELSQEYAQFRGTFEEGTVVAGGKSFVRGAVVNANKVVKDSNGSSVLYKPKVELIKRPVMGSTFEQAKKLAEEKARKMMAEAQRTNSAITQRPPRPGTTQQKSRTSNLEAFKEELKNLQEQRQQRRTLRTHMEQMGVEKEALDRIAPLIDNPYLHGNGEYDNDPHTTNIYLSNLALEIKVEDLYETFGTFGPLASAKILYPRDDERKRERLCGFVAFMSRKDTDRSLKAMQGELIHGSPLRLSLAKPVNIPSQPMYVPPALGELAMPDPPTGLPFNAKARKRDIKVVKTKCSMPHLGDPPPEAGKGKEEYDKMIRNAVVRVVVPTERSLLLIIHRTIEFIIREGPLFEAMLMSRERHNPAYRFLFDNHHPAHVYFRWKLYSMLQGDAPNQWRMKQFRMFDDGSWWEPPPPNVITEMPECLYHTAYCGVEGNSENPESRMHRHSSSEEEDDERKAEVKAKWRGVLSTSERDELEDILRDLVPEKWCVADAMLWCADHASCAKEISQCLLESLGLSETPLHKKLARLYLIVDILANCAARVRDVFYYRQYLGDIMPDIFKELNKAYEAIEGRLRAEQFKQRIMLCFRTWEDNSLYPTDFLIQLQNIFLGLTAKDDVSEDDIDGAPLEEDEKEEFEEKPVEKETIFDEDDIDGAPLEEDQSRSPLNQATVFKASQWNTVDPSVVASQAVTTSKWDALENGKDYSPNGSPYDTRNEQEVGIDGEPMDNGGSEDGECPDEDDDDRRTAVCRGNSRDSSAFASASQGSSRLDEHRRKILREIEVKVVKLQDELEADRCEDVSTQVHKYRNSLVKKMEEELASFGASKSKKRKDKRKRSRSRKRDEKHNRERERDKGRSGDRERSRDKDRQRIRDKDRGRDKGRDKDRSRSRERKPRRERSSERRRR